MSSHASPPAAPEVRIFVDGMPRSVPEGTSVGDAVAAGEAELAGLLRAGRAYVTDGVGRPIEPSGAVFPGAIYRVVRSPRREPRQTA